MQPSGEACSWPCDLRVIAYGYIARPRIPEVRHRNAPAAPVLELWPPAPGGMIRSEPQTDSVTSGSCQIHARTGSPRRSFTSTEGPMRHSLSWQPQVEGDPKRPPKQSLAAAAYERPSNQVSNKRHAQRRTPADIDGRQFPGQAHRGAGSACRDLASGRRGPGLHARCGHGRRSRRSGASRRRRIENMTDAAAGHQVGSERLIMPNTCLGWHTARRLACSGRGSSVP